MSYYLFDAKATPAGRFDDIKRAIGRANSLMIKTGQKHFVVSVNMEFPDGVVYDTGVRTILPDGSFYDRRGNNCTKARFTE